ncbi:hypothetical protein [Micromonospora sp. NPDC048843]
MLYCLASIDVNRTVEKNDGLQLSQSVPEAQIKSNGTSGQFALFAEFNG